MPPDIKGVAGLQDPPDLYETGAGNPSAFKRSSGTGVFYIVSGKGEMTVEGQEVEVRAGHMILVDKGESRGIRATETMMAFVVHII